MSASGSDSAARRARALHPDEETRYRAVAGLDPAQAEDRAVLVGRLGDPSWRVRSAAAEAVARAPGAAPLDDLVRVLASGPGVGAREAAAAALARVGSRAVPPLVERLAAVDDPDLRQAAAAVLGAIGDRRAVPSLAARLADADPNVRAAAADALGKIGGAEAIAALRAAVDSDDPTLRLSAIEALVQLGAPLPVERVEALLADRPLRRALYRMLGASDDPRAVGIVARGAAGPSRPGRDAALGALGHQRAHRDPEELAAALAQLRGEAERDPGLADAWAAALGAEEPLVAVGALTALAAAGAARHAGRIAKLAEDERYRALVEEALERLPQGAEVRTALADALPGLGQLARITALASLARLGSPAALESVIREASDDGSYVQGDAIAALGRLRDARAIPPLAGLLGDDDPRTAGAAASALVRIGQAGPAEREAVLAAVRDRAEASPSVALYRAVGALGGAEDADRALAGLGAAGVAERAAAAAACRALAQRRVLPERGVPAIVAALSDAAGTVRAAAARALAEVARVRPRESEPDPALRAVATRALVAGLRDLEPPVRAAAAEALGACGDPEHAPAVAALVEGPDPAPPVVVAALHALVAMGRVAPATIAGAVRHADAEVVKEAVLCAARVAGEEGARILRDAAASPRWDVRRAAAAAMTERGDPALRPDAERLAAGDPDPLVARAFAEAARALGER
jgi:HEAT repeat protein